MASSSEAGPRRIVVDANRVVSALLRDGSTRAAFFERTCIFFAPEMLREEIERYLPTIAKRSGLTQRDLRTLAGLLFETISWVSEASYKERLVEARRALEAVDPKDVPYLACALAVRADAIWSFDLGFERQRLVPRVPHPDAPLR